MSAKARCPAGQGRGATVLSPYPASRAGARGHDVFVATSIKETVLSARLRRCEPRRRPYRFFEARCPSWSATPTLLSACRAFLAAPRCAINRLFNAARGPRADAVPRAVALARMSKVGTRWDGGGVRPASPVPVASNSSPIAVLTMTSRPIHAAVSFIDARGCTPRRPSTCSSMCACSAPSGRALFD